MFRLPTAVGRNKKTRGRGLSSISKAVERHVVAGTVVRGPHAGRTTGAPDCVRRTPFSRERPISRFSAGEHAGLRPFPTQSWIEGIRSFAIAPALNIVVCSQVEDEPRSGEIAAALSRDIAHHEGWGSLSDLHQERRVRDLCTRCAPVVTDRLPLASRVCRVMSLAWGPPKSYLPENAIYPL